MMGRRIVIATLLLVNSIAVTQACRGPQFEFSIVLDDLTGIDAPVVMQITITKMLKNERPQPDLRVPFDQYDQYVDRFTQLGFARVDRVIRGEWSDPSVVIAVLPTSCGPYIDAGLSGVVAGSIERNSHGGAVLVPVMESETTRANRLKKASGG